MTTIKEFAKINIFYMLSEEEMTNVIEDLLDQTNAYVKENNPDNKYPSDCIGFISVLNKEGKEIFFPVFVQFICVEHDKFPRYHIGGSFENPNLEYYTDKNSFETTENDPCEVSVTSIVDDDGNIDSYFIDYEYGYQSVATNENGVEMASYLRIINSETHYMYQIF